MASITQNTENQAIALPLLDALDLHCFWARFFDQVGYTYEGKYFSDDTISYFQTGAGWVQRAGQPKMAWQAPVLLLFRKTQAYAASSTGPIQAHSMHFRAELSGKPPVSLMDLLDIPPVLPTALAEPVAPIMVAMSDEYRDKRLGSQLVLDGHLRILLALCMRCWWPQLPAAPTALAQAVAHTAGVAGQAALEPTPAASRRGILRLAPALTWMAAHLAEPLSVPAMAAQVGVSAGHFTAVFKQTFRTTPAQYLIQLRIDRARRLLLTTDLTVNQIAHTLGFSYPHYFIRQFKQTTTQTPAQYRAVNLQ